MSESWISNNIPVCLDYVGWKSDNIMKFIWESNFFAEELVAKLKIITKKESAN